jgi:hypothetical protein
MRPEREADQSSPSSGKANNAWDLPPFSHTSSWSATRFDFPVYRQPISEAHYHRRLSVHVPDLETEFRPCTTVLLRTRDSTSEAPSWFPCYGQKWRTLWKRCCISSTLPFNLMPGFSITQQSTRWQTLTSLLRSKLRTVYGTVKPKDTPVHAIKEHGRVEYNSRHS